MPKTKHNSKRPWEPQVVLQLATERVYRAAIQSKGKNEKESNIALGILFDARKYILGSLYPDGPFAEDAKRHALTGYYADLHFEVEKQIKAAITGKPVCCDCATNPCECYCAECEYPKIRCICGDWEDDDAHVGDDFDEVTDEP